MAADGHKSIVVSPEPVQSREVRIDFLRVSIEFIKPDDTTWQQEMPESGVVLDDQDLRFKLVISGIEQPNQQALEQMGFHHLHLTTTATHPALYTRLNLFGPSTEIATANGTTEIRVKLSRAALKLAMLVPQLDDDGIDDERSSLDHVANEYSTFGDSQAFMKEGNDWEFKHRGHSLNDESSSLANVVFNSPLDRTFIQAGGAELMTVKVEGMTDVQGKAMLMNQADVFYYSGHGNSRTDNAFMPNLEALNPGDGHLTPDDLKPYWDRDMNCAVIAGCAVLNINNWVAFPSYYAPLDGLGASYWPGKEMEKTGPDFLLGYGSKAPLDTQGSTAIAATFIRLYESSGDAFDSWRAANNNSNGRNAVAIHKDTKYGYFKYTVLAGVIPSYEWTVKPKVGDWNP